MSNAPNRSSRTTAEAFEALKTYHAGSGRAVLWLLDEAVPRSLKDPTERAALEEGFILLLRGQCSEVAKQYACSKLELIGTQASVSALVALVPDPHVCASARTALERIPGTAAAQALRASVGKLTGTARLGAIASLGAMRDAGSVALLVPFLHAPDPALASAAAYALGQIGSARAATVLKSFLEVVPAPIRLRVADAALTCAEYLRSEGHNQEAREVYQALASPALPAYVRQAARLGLEG